MNYDFLLHERPLPSYFKIISISIIIFLGMYFKFTNGSDVNGDTLGLLKWILYLGLCMHLISKDKIEDERSKEIQLQIHRIGFRLFLGVLMMLFGAHIRDDDFNGYPMLYIFVISILGFLVILSGLARNSFFTNLIEKNRLLYLLSILLIMSAIVFFNQWPWSWPTN